MPKYLMEIIELQKAILNYHWQRNKKVYGFFLILPETGLLTPPVLGKIFITFFRRRPQATIQPSCREEDFDRDERTDDYKRWLHYQPYKANIPMFSLAEVIEVAIRAEYQVAR